jgi:hypothetical protein
MGIKIIIVRINLIYMRDMETAYINKACEAVEWINLRDDQTADSRKQSDPIRAGNTLTRLVTELSGSHGAECKDPCLLGSSDI